MIVSAEVRDGIVYATADTGEITQIFVDNRGRVSRCFATWLPLAKHRVQVINEYPVDFPKCPIVLAVAVEDQKS